MTWSIFAGLLLAATGAGIVFKKNRLPALLAGLLLTFLLLYHVPGWW